MNAKSALTIVATMPPALTPKGPLTVVANQGTEEMATTVQVRACQVFPIFSLVLTTFYGQKITLKFSGII